MAMAHFHSPPNLINLVRGWPAPSLLPTALLQHASQKALSNPSITEYGLPYGLNEGPFPARKAIAQFLTEFYRPKSTASSPITPITPDRLVLTGGASQNLARMTQVFADPEYTRRIWMVSPTYFLAHQIFEDAGFSSKICAVPEDAQGIDIAYLTRKLDHDEVAAKKDGSWMEQPSYRFKPHQAHSKIYRHILYCVPTFSNPSSRVMTLRRRQELVKLARKHDILIISDDVYDRLQWRVHLDQPCADSEENLWARSSILPRLVDVDRFLDREDVGAEDDFGNTISNGSFSKLLAPGVRTGWAEGSTKLMKALSMAGSSKSGGPPSNLMAIILSELLLAGDVVDSLLVERIQNTLIPAYSRRFHALYHAVKRELYPLGCLVPTLEPKQEEWQFTPKMAENDTPIFGGYFLWVKLPDGVSATRLEQIGKAKFGVVVASGRISEVYGDERRDKDPRLRYDDFIRLSFAWEDEETLSEGVKRIAAALRHIEERRAVDGNSSAELPSGRAQPDPSM